MSDKKPNDQNGWNEYSKLVLKELETLASGIDSLTAEMKKVQAAIQRLEMRESKVNELVAWKEKVDNVWSSVQMKEHVDKVAEFETFKTRAVTVFLVVQFLMGAAVVIQNFL